MPRHMNNNIFMSYCIEAPCTEVNQTVNSPPQAATFTSDTWHRTGDNSSSAK